MLKSPAVPTINKEMSYANGCISEYLGCHFFESVGIPVQETLLGTYTKKGRQKSVVACKDFTAGGLVLQDFASLKNTIIDSAHNGYGTELQDIVTTFEEQTAIDPQKKFLRSTWGKPEDRFERSMFEQALKTNDSLYFAVLTG